MDLRVPLLEAKDEQQPGIINVFSQQFIASQRAYFRMACDNAGLKETKNDLERIYLDPIITSMEKLSLGEASADQAQAIIKQIEHARKSFVTTYKSSYTKTTLSQMNAAFTKLSEHTKQHLICSYYDLISQINSSASDADARISEAKLRKLKDICCILACIGWCPIENLLTIFNWFGVDQRGNCCVQECVSANLANGSWSMWAPMGSIRSLKQDIEEQNTIIQQKTPIAMTMI